MNSCWFFLILLAYYDLRSVYALMTSRPSTNSSFESAIENLIELKRQQLNSPAVSTCGFRDGDANLPRTANPGFDCRVDTQHALWGFCPTTVIAATDCGLAGNCVDAHACSRGCGIVGTPGITTFTCTGQGADFCSTAILTAGPDQTYSYIACAPAAVTDHLLVAATTKSTTSTTPTSSSSPQASVVSTTVSLLLSPTSSFSTTSTPVLASLITSTSSSSSYRSMTASSSVADTSNSTFNNVAAIVGGVIGGAALICFVALAVLFMRWHKRQHGARKDDVVPLYDNFATFRQVADTHEEYKYENSGYPDWKRMTPVELSTMKPNSPYELST